MHPVSSSLTSPQQVNGSILGYVYMWCVVWLSDASRFVLPHITTTGERNYGEKCWCMMCCWIIWCRLFDLRSHHHTWWTEVDWECWFVMGCWLISCKSYCPTSHNHNWWTEVLFEMFTCDVLLDHLIHLGLYAFSSPQEVHRTILKNVYLWRVVRPSDASRFIFPHITTTGEPKHFGKSLFVMCCWINWCIRFGLPSHHHNRWTKLC